MSYIAEGRLAFMKFNDLSSIFHQLSGQARYAEADEVREQALMRLEASFDAFARAYRQLNEGTA
jgi:hypothetical protein